MHTTEKYVVDLSLVNFRYYDIFMKRKSLGNYKKRVRIAGLRVEILPETLQTRNRNDDRYVIEFRV